MMHKILTKWYAWEQSSRPYSIDSGEIALVIDHKTYLWAWFCAMCLCLDWFILEMQITWSTKLEQHLYIPHLLEPLLWEKGISIDTPWSWKLNQSSYWVKIVWAKCKVAKFLSERSKMGMIAHKTRHPQNKSSSSQKFLTYLMEVA